MKTSIYICVLSAIMALPVHATEFPVPQEDLDLWGFMERADVSRTFRPAEESTDGAKVIYQPIRMTESTDEYILIQECYPTVEQAQARINSIPKLNNNENGGIYEKGFNIQGCAYIVNAPKKSMVRSLRYTVYPLFFAHMAGRHDFLYYVTAASGANLRKSADDNSEVKAKLPPKSVVYIINSSADWKTAVTIKGSGYIHQDLVKKIYP